MALLRLARSFLRWAIPIALIILMMFWLTGAFRKDVIAGGKVQTETRPAAGLTACPVTLVRAPAVYEAVGTVQPQHKMTLSSRVAGNVLEMRARAGQLVHKDDLLVRLDDRDLRAAANQARESLSHAEAARSLAISDYNRDKPLVDSGAIAPAEFDQTDARRKMAEADTQRAREAQREAEVALSYTEIRSPADGTIVDKLADVGDQAVPGKPLLAMYDQESLWLEANVREQQASRLHLGEVYTVKLDATGAQMTGKLAEIIPSSDPASRVITARVALPPAEGLYPGMFGRLSIPIQEAGTLLIPEAALIHVGQLAMVDVIDAGMLKRRSVQIGARQDGNVEILSGLVEGEQVALPGANGAQQ